MSGRYDLWTEKAWLKLVSFGSFFALICLAFERVQGLTHEAGRKMIGLSAVFAAFFFWGLWGYASYHAAQRAHPYTIQWIMCLPNFVMAPLWYYCSRRIGGPAIPDRGTFLWAVGSCLASIVGVFFYNVALKIEKPGMVIGVTSAYPLLTFFLFVIAGIESFRWQHFLAFVMIIAGMILLQVKPQ